MTVSCASEVAGRNLVMEEATLVSMRNEMSRVYRIQMVESKSL